MQHLSCLGWPRGEGGVQAQDGELTQDGEQMGVFHVPAESPVCLAKGTTSQLSPALWDLQLGFLSPRPHGRRAIWGCWQNAGGSCRNVALPRLPPPLPCNLKECDSTDGPVSPAHPGKDIPQQTPDRCSAPMPA